MTSDPTASGVERDAHRVEDSRHEGSEPDITVSALMAAEAEPIEDEPVLTGEDMGKYMLIGELATGGMAEIFLAVHKGPEGFLKVVVIKRVLPHLTENPDFVAMFADEARLAARLEHPNIVRTYEFGSTEGQYFTVMEYLPGEDLSSVLRRLGVSAKILPIQVAAAIVRDVCRGVHFAHELTDMSGRTLGLVHRDINPSNIIVTYSGEVKIIDFGVAKANTNVSKTIAGTIKGKMCYMAPEQILGRGIDRRADVFSTGIVLWELLTGASLFNRESEAATMYAIMNDPLPPPSRHRPDVPPELDEIVLRALSRTPADRFDTMEELELTLDKFIATQPPIEPRYLSATLESLFGSVRADAKRAIARTQQLRRNISLVMKLRSDVRSDLAKLQSGLTDANNLAVDAPRGPESATVNFVPAAPRSKAPLVVGALVLLAIGGGLAYMVLSDPGAPQSKVQARTSASVSIESKPDGAAVFVNGEPTGLKTPATLTDVRAGQLAIRLETAGYAPFETKIEAIANQVVKKSFTLERINGRLVIGKLPAGAVVVIGDNEYAAGEVISVPVGAHQVRVVVDGKAILEQQVEVGSGDQLWDHTGDRLVRK